MVTLDTEQKPERQHCGRRMCAICRRIKRDKGKCRLHFTTLNGENKSLKPKKERESEREKRIFFYDLKVRIYFGINMTPSSIFVARVYALVSVAGVSET